MPGTWCRTREVQLGLLCCSARKKYATVYALVYALSESGVHVLYAASFKFGFFLIRSGLMDLVKVYR
jgi:hypothetical protein